MQNLTVNWRWILRCKYKPLDHFINKCRTTNVSATIKLRSLQISAFLHIAVCVISHTYYIVFIPGMFPLVCINTYSGYIKIYFCVYIKKCKHQLYKASGLNLNICSRIGSHISRKSSIKSSDLCKDKIFRKRFPNAEWGSNELWQEHWRCGLVWYSYG